MVTSFVDFICCVRERKTELWTLGQLVCFQQALRWVDEDAKACVGGRPGHHHHVPRSHVG